MTRIGRRAALRWLGRVPVWAALALAAVQQACMGDATTAPAMDPNGAPAGGTGGTAAISTCADGISLNHGHTACIPQATWDAPAASNAITLSLALGHTHTVTLTDQQIMTIKNNAAQIDQLTDADATLHSHTVTWLV